MKINAKIVFQFGDEASPKEKERFSLLKDYFEGLFSHLDFEVFVDEAQHYDEGNKFYPKCSALEIKLVHPATDNRCVHNLIKIVEASLQMYTSAYEVLYFRYSF